MRRSFMVYLEARGTELLNIYIIRCTNSERNSENRREEWTRRWPYHVLPCLCLLTRFVRLLFLVVVSRFGVFVCIVYLFSVVYNTVGCVCCVVFVVGDVI